MFSISEFDYEGELFRGAPSVARFSFVGQETSYNSVFPQLSKDGRSKVAAGILETLYDISYKTARRPWRNFGCEGTWSPFLLQDNEILL